VKIEYADGQMSLIEGSGDYSIVLDDRRVIVTVEGHRFVAETMGSCAVGLEYHSEAERTLCGTGVHDWMVPDMFGSRDCDRCGAVLQSNGYLREGRDW
jgi:hypothetical protein